MQQTPDDPNHILSRAYGMDVGQVSPPFHFADQWIVFQVLEKKPAGLAPFDNPQVKKDATRAATVEHQEALLKTMLADLRQKYPVTVHEDVLALAHLPARPSAAVAGSAEKPGGMK